MSADGAGSWPELSQLSCLSLDAFFFSALRPVLEEPARSFADSSKESFWAGEELMQPSSNGCTCLITASWSNEDHRTVNLRAADRSDPQSKAEMHTLEAAQDVCNCTKQHVGSRCLVTFASSPIRPGKSMVAVTTNEMTMSRLSLNQMGLATARKGGKWQVSTCKREAPFSRAPSAACRAGSWLILLRC